MSIVPESVPTGAIRYNTDSNKMECFDGNKWWQVSVSSPDLNGGTRGFFAGGKMNSPATETNSIEYITISSKGNGTDFGDLTQAVRIAATLSNRTRGMRMGGYVAPTSTAEIDYLQLTSTGNAVDWGTDLGTGSYHGCGLANQTRGVYAQGINHPSPSAGTNLIEYSTIATTGTRGDFGDLTAGTANSASNSSPTRGLFIGGSDGTSPSPSWVKRIDYVTIGTTGNAQDYGDLSGNRGMAYGGGNAIRAIVTSGYDGSSYLSNSETINMVTKGRGIICSDTPMAGEYGASMSSSTRFVYGAGYTSPAGKVNTIEYINIQTLGDSVDFGDLGVVDARGGGRGFSNGHGGL